MQLDALIINPGDQKRVYQGLSEDVTAKAPPIWCRLLASFLTRKKWTVDILDALAFGMPQELVAEHVAYHRPTLAVVVAHGHQPSASTQSMPVVVDTCRAIKEVCDVPILVVGGHPAALPERTLHEANADYICLGEGPYSANSLLDCLTLRSDISRVSGIGRFADGQFVRNKPALNVADLDTEMPGGRWRYLPMGKYRAHNHQCLDGSPREPYATVYSSLNCSWQCGFCMISTVFREGDRIRSGGKPVNYYRTWSGKTIAAEIRELVEVYGVTTIRFDDEMFCLNPGHVKGVCGEIIKLGYGDRLSLWCYTRIDTCREDLLGICREAGFKWFCPGIEAASTDVRDGVDKSEYDAEDILRACERIKSAGINILANLMVGLPNDTHESMRETMALALEIMPEWMNVYGTMVYPGSPLWDSLPEEKRNYDWKTYAHHGYECTPAGNANLTPAEVLKFRDDAFMAFFTNPGYLSYIKNKFGQKAVEMVKNMTKVKLKRKLLGD